MSADSILDGLKQANVSGSQLFQDMGERLKQLHDEIIARDLKIIELEASLEEGRNKSQITGREELQAILKPILQEGGAKYLEGCRTTCFNFTASMAGAHCSQEWSSQNYKESLDRVKEGSKNLKELIELTLKDQKQTAPAQSLVKLSGSWKELETLMEIEARKVEEIYHKSTGWARAEYANDRQLAHDHLATLRSVAKAVGIDFDEDMMDEDP